MDNIIKFGNQLTRKTRGLRVIFGINIAIFNYLNIKRNPEYNTLRLCKEENSPTLNLLESKLAIWSIFKGITYGCFPYLTCCIIGWMTYDAIYDKNDFMSHFIPASQHKQIFSRYLNFTYYAKYPYGRHPCIRP